MDEIMQSCMYVCFGLCVYIRLQLSAWIVAVVWAWLCVCVCKATITYGWKNAVTYIRVFWFVCVFEAAIKHIDNCSHVWLCLCVYARLRTSVDDCKHVGIDFPVCM